MVFHFQCQITFIDLKSQAYFSEIIKFSPHFISPPDNHYSDKGSMECLDIYIVCKLARILSEGS